MKKRLSKNIQTVLGILKNEVDGDVRAALQKMDKSYSMTWMYESPKRKELFPETKNDLESELEEAYPIKGRKYEIYNIAENKEVVIVELVESYPDPKTKRMYRTPLVLVLEMKNGKIKTGRHYCDPKLSYKKLKPEKLSKVYKNKKPIITIK